ncbi:MAG: CDP-diacylglycerol--glycerol-3-phosphate 3-phosphatidyltransferase [Candidatus Omnitrophica bacterium]|nr:CDP-diacylglycerol--glycerol-3-phosphate 3-phosphatidyltransferase [Candidatus Omnitrophota bacterium]MCK5259809.1 CDP-diacylglycerol--glycerol-3-phosphate 3-phosphatidyltransferase [Candidatus Omnitrophota bacterium]
MNLPNLLTVLRIVLTLIFIFFLHQEGLEAKVLALLAFTLAVLTDYLDGYYARKLNLITAFGKIMDPIADKILMLSAFFIFSQMHIIAGWMFIVICAREVTVTGLRLSAIPRGITLAAESAGKVKTVLQIVAVYLIIILIILAQFDVNAQWYGNVMSVLAGGITIFMFGVVAITLWSGCSFVWNNRKELF